jgi:hypothetical protein
LLTGDFAFSDSYRKIDAICAEGEKVRLRERVIAMRHRRHRLSMRDRLRHRRRLVEIGLKAKGK